MLLVHFRWKLHQFLSWTLCCWYWDYINCSVMVLTLYVPISGRAEESATGNWWTNWWANVSKLLSCLLGHNLMLYTFLKLSKCWFLSCSGHVISKWHSANIKSLFIFTSRSRLLLKGNSVSVFRLVFDGNKSYNFG